MKRMLAFSERNRKEILRDPLSYLFCLGFPLVMLLIMTVLDASIPKEAGMTIFHIDNLAGGIAVFGCENLYDGWMKNKRSAMISCNDGFRPVSFLLEALEEDAN